VHIVTYCRFVEIVKMMIEKLLISSSDRTFTCQPKGRCFKALIKSLLHLENKLAAPLM